MLRNFPDCLDFTTGMQSGVNLIVANTNIDVMSAASWNQIGITHSVSELSWGKQALTNEDATRLWPRAPLHTYRARLDAEISLDRFLNELRELLEQKDQIPCRIMGDKGGLQNQRNCTYSPRKELSGNANNGERSTCSKLDSHRIV